MGQSLTFKQLQQSRLEAQPRRRGQWRGCGVTGNLIPREPPYFERFILLFERSATVLLPKDTVMSSSAAKSGSDLGLLKNQHALDMFAETFNHALAAGLRHPDSIEEFADNNTPDIFQLAHPQTV